MESESEKFRKLFIGGLNYDTDDDGLRAHFEQWGVVVDCVVVKDAATSKSRGFGFVTYQCSSMVDEAQRNRPHELDGRELDTKRAIPRNEGDESHATVKKMFVGGLKADASELDIRNAFSDFGAVENVEVFSDRATGKRKGFCFVTFFDYDSVDKCVLRRKISVCGKEVEVKKAVSKGDQRRSVWRRGRGRARGYGADWNGATAYTTSQGWDQGRTWNTGASDGYFGCSEQDVAGWGSSFGYENQSSGGPVRGGGYLYDHRTPGPYGRGYGSGFSR